MTQNIVSVRFTCSENGLITWIDVNSHIEFFGLILTKIKLIDEIKLQMFASTHYAGKETGMKFKEGEAWKKVFGPVSIYLNSLSSRADSTLPLPLWDNAKQQVLVYMSIYTFYVFLFLSLFCMYKIPLTT